LSLGFTLTTKYVHRILDTYKDISYDYVPEHRPFRYHELLFYFGQFSLISSSYVFDNHRFFELDVSRYSFECPYVFFSGISLTYLLLYSSFTMSQHGYIAIKKEDIHHERFFRIFEKLSTNMDVLKHFLRIASLSSRIQLNDCRGPDPCSSILCSRHGHNFDERTYHIQGPNLLKVGDFLLNPLLLRSQLFNSRSLLHQDIYSSTSFSCSIHHFNYMSVHSDVLSTLRSIVTTDLFSNTTFEVIGDSIPISYFKKRAKVKTKLWFFYKKKK